MTLIIVIVPNRSATNAATDQFNCKYIDVSYTVSSINYKNEAI